MDFCKVRNCLLVKTRFGLPSNDASYESFLPLVFMEKKKYDEMLERGDNLYTYNITFNNGNTKTKVISINDNERPSKGWEDSGKFPKI